MYFFSINCLFSLVEASFNIFISISFNFKLLAGINICRSIAASLLRIRCCVGREKLLFEFEFASLNEACVIISEPVINCPWNVVLSLVSPDHSFKQTLIISIYTNSHLTSSFVVRRVSSGAVHAAAR